MNIRINKIIISLFLSFLLNCHVESLTKEKEEDRRMRCADSYFAYVNAPPVVERDAQGNPIDRVTAANLGLISCLTFLDNIPRGFFGNGDPREIRP